MFILSIIQFYCTYVLVMLWVGSLCYPEEAAAPNLTDLQCLGAVLHILLEIGLK